MNRTVTIIIPAFNVERYIEKCLISVCDQTYRDLQIIVVDDGSSDRTFSSIEDFSNKDSRITAIHKDNGGVSSARNLAISHATGDYVFFLDADDILEINAISVLVKEMESSNVDWVSYHHSRWDENGNKLDDYVFDTGIFSFSSDKDRFDFIIKEFLPYRVGVEASNKLFKRKIISDNNLFFSEKCHIGEDFSFSIKYLMHSSSLSSISDKLYRYIIRENSSMGSSGDLDRKVRERINMLIDIWEHLVNIENEFMIHRFPLLFVLLLNNSCIGYSASEVSDKLEKIEPLDFVKDNYRNLPKFKSYYFELFPSGISRIKYSYHMYIRSRLMGFSLLDKVYFGLYNQYRIMKKEKKIELWEMPN